MKNLLNTIFVIIPIVAIQVCGQTVYSGTIGKAAVEFVVGEIDNDSQIIEGVYLYKKFSIPIPLSGTYSNHILILNESNDCKLIFKEYYENKTTIFGSWTDSKSNKKFPVILQKEYNFNRYDTTEQEWQRELLQVASLKTFYFKIVVTKDGYVSGLKIFEKKTGRLFQDFDTLDCRYLLGTRSVEIASNNNKKNFEFSLYKDSDSAPLDEERLFFIFDSAMKVFRY